MLLQESDLCNRLQKETLLKKIEGEPENFSLLLDWSLLAKKPLGWRAAWLLRQISVKNDARILPAIDRVISNYSKFDESQKREWLKNLYEQPLTDEQEGMLFDLCITDWQKIGHHPALRASSLQLVFRILKKYPELIQEVNHLMVEDYLSPLSPGIRRSLEKQWLKLSASS